jgi:hypothetical protein
MTEPSWKLDDDRQTVTVTFPSDPPAVLKLSAAGVDSLLHGLGGLRTLMQPQPAPDFATGQQFTAVPDPSFVTEVDGLQGNPVIHLRDPRFGWLHYMLPKERARSLGVSLAMQADTTLTI